jgi:predicted O-methyltransferase YrrM
MDLVNFYNVINEIETNGGLGMRTPGGTARMIYGLAKAMEAKVYIDVGTFVGLSALWVARAMEELGAGKVYTVELDPNWLDMAKNFANKSNLSHRIEFIAGDSREVLPNLPISVADLILLDSGNKDNYPIDFQSVEKYITKDTIILGHDVIEPEKVPFYPAWKFKSYIENRKEYESFLMPKEYGTLFIRRK